ncbi:hypothetical protein FH972_018737 [Carpinus fangiana]|uniref:Sacsin/Nov domain-containing protein n=1 Tax=Carpinus fangiana TaxID=176857 RepID=A0A5N6RRH4_9ROSI|nr:hypothetical protein FH972_018737 [Carpinus fangiana]
MEAAAREHIEAIRKKKFSIGGEENPLTEDLHQAVKNLSAELYAKDVHFLMELIQNAEDNNYMEGVDPSLEFIITSQDITATGAPATLMIFNNEIGFSSKNIDSICSVGRSTKKGNRKRGYIGEKGIGFKSVFLVTAQPYIFSNGYQIRFNEEPCPHCNLGYIVPEWVEENPAISDINQIYGYANTLPTTTIVLPLKPDKIQAVKEELSSIHPEVLLFLSKIKRFSVKEHNKDAKLNTVSAIAITSETDFVTKKSIDAESYTLHLSTNEKKNEGSDKECSYYMWKQKFPVRQENKVERRMEVEELVITLAFPFQERLNRGMSSPGVYAFLPTEMFTNFPFIIQADFLLASSRETILFDNKWNKGILDCVPSAFINALVSLIRTSENAPVSSLAPMFKFIPVNRSSYKELNIVRESIKAKLVEENIVPSESYTKQIFFHKPREVCRLMPAFWNILEKAKNEGVSLLDLSSHGNYILSCGFDRKEYDHVLSFLGVGYVVNNWYVKCIGSSNLVAGVSEELYMDILLFVADNWNSKFHNTNIRSIPLIKYVGHVGDVALCSINECTPRNLIWVMLSQQNHLASWLIDWNREFRCVGGHFFMPKTNLNYYLKKDRKLAVAFVHFLYHSLSKNHLSKRAVENLCHSMPIADNYGNLTTQRKGVLVPAKGSKWVGLVGSNPWRGEGYVELGEDYLHPGRFAGEFTSGEQLLNFLKTYVAASDIPYISPPNSVIPAVSSPLTNENAFLLLDWIRNFKQRHICIPERFLKCIKEGSWLKVTANGCSGYRAPYQSFMFSSSLGNILQNGSVLVDIPLIDQSFYGDRINEYKEELKMVGVMFQYGEACEFIGKHLMSLTASSTLTRGLVLSVLNFIKFLRENSLPLDKFINSIKERKWLRTSRGDRSPVGSVLFDVEWKIASQISDIPFIDIHYYGEEILAFKEEMKSLGVLIGYCKSYNLVVDNLRPSSRLTFLTAEAVHLILESISHSRSSNKLIEALQGVKCFKTNMGYNSPGECFLFDSQWGCILQKKTGVMVDFEDAVKVFTYRFRQHASSMTKETTKETVMSLLSCYRKLKDTPFKFPSDLWKCIREEEWLRTRLGVYRSPRSCILFGPDWQSISPITVLHFIDDSDNYYGKDIHEYMEELKVMGVVDIKDGVKMVAAGLYFPQDHSCITPDNVLKLLECIRILLQDRDYSFPDKFWEEISQKWLKTHVGYRPPKECLLFNSRWGSYLKHTDGPFLDEGFYGSSITPYKEELRAIGVTVDVENGCRLISSHLDFHLDQFSIIVRIYNYLSEFNWKPDSDATKRIWIPNESQVGKWVGPPECVLHDEDGLFSLQLQVLEKHYDPKLLNFFSNAFLVRHNPSVDDYCKLWKVWESSGQPLSNADCCKFWVYVSKHWSEKTKKTLAGRLVKLPVGSSSDGILLSNKHDVFIADDLQLKDLFEHFYPHPIFAWCPRESLPSLPRRKLLEMYRIIGVRTISESVQKEELVDVAHLNQVNPKETVLKKGMVRLILGFLADPTRKIEMETRHEAIKRLLKINFLETVEPINEESVDVAHLNQVNPKETVLKKGMVRLILGFLADPTRKIEMETRHEAIKRLLKINFLETVEPINVNYSLSLSSGEIVKAKATRVMLWDRLSSKFVAQKLDRCGGYKYIIEYATYFSEAISEGLLWDNNDHIGPLSELIKLGFMMEFNDEAVGFLMSSKCLQIFMEDFNALCLPSGNVAELKWLSQFVDDSSESPETGGSSVS